MVMKMSVDLFPRSLDEIYNRSLDIYDATNILRISDLSICSLRAYLNAKLRSKPKITANMLAGSYIHKVIQRSIIDKDNQWKAEVQVVYNLPNDWKLIGHADLVKDKVIEIKTTSSPYTITNDLIRRWFMQANFYANMLNLDDIEIWIVDITSGAIDVCDYKSSKTVFEDTILIANETINSNFRHVSINTKYCNTCPYIAICKDIGAYWRVVYGDRQTFL